MTTFSRKADALQHVGAATDNESGWRSANTSSAASSACFMMLERSLRTTRHDPHQWHVAWVFVACAAQVAAPPPRGRRALDSAIV